VPVAPQAQRLLDVAGSHGLYGALICRAHPPMRAEVLDLPDAVEQSRELARREGIDDVVTHRAGDVRRGPLGADYDVCFLGNILHHLAADEARDLLGRVRRALRDAGTAAIWELRRPEPDAPPDAFADAWALFFRVTSTGRCYASSEYAGWLEEVGFTDVRVHTIPQVPFQVLVTGRT
jgi:SAM-dependent methyltransferase